MRELRQNWHDLFFGFRIALDPKKMLLGFVGLLLSLLALIALAWAFSGSFPGAKDRLLDAVARPWERPGGSVMVCDMSGGRAHMRECRLMTLAADCFDKAFPVDMKRMSRMCGWRDEYGLVGGMEDCSWGVCALGARTVNLHAMLFLGVYGLLLLLIWSFLGGAIARIAAVEFAKDDRMDISEATAFSGKKYFSFLWGPLLPVICIAFFVGCLMLFGLAGRIPAIGPILAGLFWFLPLAAGALIVVVAIGLAIGAPLMFATIAADGTDAFDALSRTYSYIFQKPWRYIWCWLTALAYGVVVTVFLFFFVKLMIAIALGVVGWAMGGGFDAVRAFVCDGSRAGFEEAGVGGKLCSILVMALHFIVWGLFFGFIVSYKATASIIIYGLLRKQVDGTDMTEVYLEEEEEDLGLTTPEAPAAGESKPDGSGPSEPPKQG